MRTFNGYRPLSPDHYASSGISNLGTSPDYQGVIFDDGTVAVRWLTTFASHSVWKCWSDFYCVHGHPEYGTELVFDDGKPMPPLTSWDMSDG